MIPSLLISHTVRCARCATTQYDAQGRFCEDSHISLDHELLIRDSFIEGDYDVHPPPSSASAALSHKPQPQS